MMIQTQRLELIPLSARQLRLWVEDTPALEAELACRYRAEPLEGFFRDIVAGQADKTAADEANYLYHTFWLLLRREDRVVVGSADFKAPPDQQGEVEIGYGLGRAFEGSGYMTEAVRAMCDWAFGQGEITAVTAETERENPASHRVLERCGFALYRDGETLWWRREKK